MGFGFMLAVLQAMLRRVGRVGSVQLINDNRVGMPVGRRICLIWRLLQMGVIRCQLGVTVGQILWHIGGSLAPGI